jgi:hypothetical protein
VRPTESPLEAADAYFEGLGTGEPTGVDDSVFRAETLALTEGELATLQTNLASLSSEKSKLQLHLDAIRSLKASGNGGTDIVTCDARPAMPAVDAASGVDPLDQTQFGTIVDAHLEAAANALLCGAAQVITMQNMFANSTLNFGFAGGPGIAKGHHDPISHSWDAAGRTEFAKCQRWFYTRLAEKFLQVLDNPDPADPANTALSNTIVMVCSEVCDGANHNSNATSVWLDGQERPSYLPFLLIGGGGGVLKTGQVVTVDRVHGDLLATVAHAMNAPLTTIGGKAVSQIPELVA